MKNANPGRGRSRRWLVGPAALAVSALGMVAIPTAGASAAAGSSCPAHVISGNTRIGSFLGIDRPSVAPRPGSCGGASVAAGEAPYVGKPPLLYHNGPVMETPSTDGIVVTPIYWAPSGYSFTSSYKSIINGYISNVAAASGQATNVFSVLTQYSGTNGTIDYRVKAGTPIIDSNAFPTSGCTTSVGSIYADGTGYSACLDDQQLIDEAANVVTARSLPNGYGHIYLMMLPKHVESCFYAGDPSYQGCTLNATNAAFCAYHSAFAANGATTPYIYADMPFPIYQSATGFSCTNEELDGVSDTIQSPNGDPDGDVEVSPLSHEVAEAITDPVGSGWFDTQGGSGEIGDDCAYIYGNLSGADGGYYNQTINGVRYLTQEEFSNADFVPNTAGCIQHSNAAPAVTSVSPAIGSASGGQSVTITGSGFTGATAVHFGSTAATTFTVTDDSHISVTAPAGSPGIVDITVTGPNGTSATGAADRYGYVGRPTITKVSPASGSKAGGTPVKISGTGFVSGAVVKFGSKTAKSIKVRSTKTITVVTPKHAAGKVNVVVTSLGGTSLNTRADRYRFV